MDALKLLLASALLASLTFLSACESSTERYRNEGISLYNAKQYDQSLAAFDKALTYSQTDARSNAYIGQIYYQKGQFVQAEFHFNVALDMDPSSEMAKEGLTETLIKMGQPDVALDRLERAAKMAESVEDPRWERSTDKRKYMKQTEENLYLGKTADRLRIGRTYEKLGDYDNAMVYYKKALELSPESANVLMALANLSEKSGNQEAAREYLRRAYRSDPATPGIVDAMTRNGIAISSVLGGSSSKTCASPCAQVIDALARDASVVPMTQTLSQKFISALEPDRDLLYAQALAQAASPARAEAALHQAARELFSRFTKNTPFPSEISTAMRAALHAPSATAQATRPTLPATPATLPDAPMPADVWARLAATVQVEAARSQESTALNPDSTLLSPDPLLAPRKKAAPPREDDRLIAASPMQIILWAAIALTLGAAVTVFIVTRSTATRAAPATSGAHPAAAGTQ